MKQFIVTDVGLENEPCVELREAETLAALQAELIKENADFQAEYDEDTERALYWIQEVVAIDGRVKFLGQEVEFDATPEDASAEEMPAEKMVRVAKDLEKVVAALRHPDSDLSELPPELQELRELARKLNKK